VLRTIGPWRPITLETYAVRLSDVRIRQDVKEDLSAELSVDLEVSENSSMWCLLCRFSELRTLIEIRFAGDLSASVVLKSSAGAVVKSAEVKVKDGKAVAEFKLAKGEVDLWYPVGYGKPALYTVDVQVADQVSDMLDL
jgi:beta-mannosidase